ncbi:maestro heat-like repeat-containing protein family member 2B [Pangshura tecta]
MVDEDKDRIALRIVAIAKTNLASVVRVLLEKLQQDEPQQNRVAIYYILQEVLQQDTGGLEIRLVKKIVSLASDQMRETQDATNEVKVAASNTLVTLASCYFDHVMYELHCHLKPPKLPEEFILITLALKCIPFVRVTLNTMFSTLEFVKDGRLRQAFCGGKCQHLLQLKQAVIKALGPMMSLLLHKEEYQDQMFEQMSWLLEQYKESTDDFHVTKSLSQLLEVSGEYKIPLPKRKFQAICSALHNQLCSQAKPLSTEHHTELVYCTVQLARSSPEDLIAFLHSQLEIEKEAVRVASLKLLRAIVDADLPETRLKKFLIVKAVKSTFSYQNATSFLYKALGTSLAVCQDLAHVKSLLHKVLTTTDYMEGSERQESHLDLTLNALQEFGAAMSKVTIPGFISHLKDHHHGRRGKTRSTLMLAYSGVAVHAPKDQLLSRVEADITGSILLHYRASCQVLGITVVNKDMDLKLILIRNVMEISCAILETRDSQEFEFSYKLELLGYMLDFIKQEPLDSLASPVRYQAILAIGHLSKLKPSLTMVENRELLDQCVRSLFPLPPSIYMRSLEALGKLMETLLEETPTADWFQEMFETRETFNQFGSLLGAIAPYSCDSLATSRQWVVDCISCLLCIQGEETFSRCNHMPAIQEGIGRQSLLEAVSVLAHHHLEAVISSLLSNPLPMDSDTSELWRSLGGDPLLTSQVLQVLIEKIKTSTSQEGSVTSEAETDRHLAAAEPLSATCAIFEVVSALQPSKAVRELLPELFPVLLQQVSRTLGQKMPLPVISSQTLFQKDQQHTEDNACR